MEGHIFHTNFKKIEPAIIWKLVTCQRITSKKVLDLDESTPEPAIRSGDTGQRIPFLTAVKWSQHWRAICVQYQFSCAPKLPRKCEIEHWLPCGVDARSLVRSVTWLPDFLGWVNLLSYGAPLARASHLDTWCSNKNLVVYLLLHPTMQLLILCLSVGVPFSRDYPVLMTWFSGYRKWLFQIWSTIAGYE